MKCPKSWSQDHLDIHESHGQQRDVPKCAHGQLLASVDVLRRLLFRVERFLGRGGGGERRGGEDEDDTRLHLLRRFRFVGCSGTSSLQSPLDSELSGSLLHCSYSEISRLRRNGIDGRLSAALSAVLSMTVR